MSRFDEKVEALIAKHPHLSKEEATKILTEKNERKKQRKAEKEERIRVKKQKSEEKRSEFE